MVIWASLLTFRHLRQETLDSSQATHTAPWFFRWGFGSDVNVESKLIRSCFHFSLRDSTLCSVMHAVCQWFTFPTTYMRLSPCFFRPTSINCLAVYTLSTPWKWSFTIVLTQLCLVLDSKLICFSKWLIKQIEKEPLFPTFYLNILQSNTLTSDNDTLITSIIKQHPWLRLMMRSLFSLQI